jgi:hypothetical protein
LATTPSPPICRTAYVSPAVHENIEDEEHDVRVVTGILYRNETQMPRFIEGDQFSINGRSHRKSFHESSNDLRELLGEVLSVSR